MAQGNVYESKVIEYLYTKFGKENIVDIGGGRDARSLEKAQRTLEEMKKGVPIIYSGVLHDHDTRTYGVPDLLVRSDWLSKLTLLSPILKVDEDILAPKLMDLEDEVTFHYRVVDIKHSTLHLTADGIGLLNMGSFPAYKGQLWIYNRALGKLQGYEPPSAYILGKRWNFCTRGEVQRGNSCFDRLGVIDFTGRDISVISKTDEAVKWVREMREHGDKWNIDTFPFERSELYPNMCNQYDHPWRYVKEKLAEDIKEITSLWQCGVKNREAAHSVDVYQWTDEGCTTETLCVNGKITKSILDSILKVNQPHHGLHHVGVISPAIIKNNNHGWQTPQPIEFFVDFEYTNLADVALCSEDRQTIFMIGVGYYRNDTDDRSWVYKNFTTSFLNPIEEKRICCEFSGYVKDVSESYGCMNPLLFHWSPAEESQWGGAYNRHNGVENAWIKAKETSLLVPKWFDLLKVFKEEPITVKGALNFGLKSIARAFYEHGFIETLWDKNSSCVDGVSAMLAAYRCDKEAKLRGITMNDLPQMKDIKKYNEIDCKVLGEIVNFLREEHTNDISLSNGTDL
jgi:hypothetical protein